MDILVLSSQEDPFILPSHFGQISHMTILGCSAQLGFPKLSQVSSSERWCYKAQPACSHVQGL